MGMLLVHARHRRANAEQKPVVEEKKGVEQNSTPVVEKPTQADKGSKKATSKKK